MVLSIAPGIAATDLDTPLTTEQLNNIRSIINKAGDCAGKAQSEFPRLSTLSLEYRHRRDALEKELYISSTTYTTAKLEMEQYQTKFTTELVQIDQQLAQSQIQIDQIKSSLKTQQAESDRFRQLYEQGAIPRIAMIDHEQRVNSLIKKLKENIQEQKSLRLKKQQILSTSKAVIQKQQKSLRQQQKMRQQQRSELTQIDIELALLKLRMSNCQTEEQTIKR
jgi:hemolysin D